MTDQPTSITEPEVTIVVTARERFSRSQRSLLSIYRHTKTPFRLIYVDGHPPAPIRRFLVEASEALGFDLIRTSRNLSPNRARNIGLAYVTTPYVAFVDNDLLVTDGWLDKLLECAEQTDAAVVGPLYFEGEPGERRIHMAGGDLRLDGEAPTRTCETVHRLQGSTLDIDAPQLERMPVDFVEFHCLLARTEDVRRLGGLDEQLLSSREHLDLCLGIADDGGTVMFEPTSEVTYLTPPPLSIGDIPFYLRRWSEAWNRASLEHFCAKHGIDRSYTERAVGMRARRQILLDPLRRGAETILPTQAARFTNRVLARAEREVNNRVFGVPQPGGELQGPVPSAG